MSAGFIVGNSKRKLSFAGPRPIRDDNIKMGIQVVGWNAWTRFILFRIERGGWIL